MCQNRSNHIKRKRTSHFLKSKLADTWLYWYWGKENTAPEPKVHHVAELFSKKHVSNVLDLGCGTGRNSIYLAKKGFDVYGFDRSSKAINRARKFSKEENLLLKLRSWNMIDFPYPYPNSYFSAVFFDQSDSPRDNWKHQKDSKRDFAHNKEGRLSISRGG
jgi:SAM-dependent methyltransferase